MSGHRSSAIGVGALVLSGIAAYVFLALAGWTLGPQLFAPLGVLWAVVFLATATLGAPLEIELARRVGAARGRGDQAGPEIANAFGLAISVGVAAVIAALLLGPALDRTIFAGQSGFSLLAAVAFAGLAAGAAGKGACAGAGRLDGWGGYLLADAGTRLFLAALAALASPSVLAFAGAMALAPWLALTVPLVVLRGSRMGPGAPQRERALRLARAIAPLVVGAGASSGVTYVGAIMLPGLVVAPDPRVGAYVAALAIARLPLFGFSPLVALAVPRIAYALERGQRQAARRVGLALIAAAVMLAAAGIAGTALAGSQVLGTLFGRGFVLPAPTLLGIAIAAGAWLVATAAMAPAVASGRAPLVAAAWGAGLLAAVTVSAVPGQDSFGRTDATVLVGAISACVAALLVTGRAMVAPTLR